MDVYESFYNKSNPISLEEKNELLQRVFNTMGLGIFISALSAIGMERLIMAGMVSEIVLFVLIIVEFILVMFLSAKLTTLPVGTAKAAFIAYSIINGATLSVVLLAYTSSSVIGSFLIAAGMFWAASLYGKTTKKDLSTMGTYLFMALFGIIIASLVNMFLRSQTFDFVISIVAIFVFIGLTIFDVSKITAMAENFGFSSDDDKSRIVILGALQLYLDFINIFLRLIRIFGKRKD